MFQPQLFSVKMFRQNEQKPERIGEALENSGLADDVKSKAGATATLNSPFFGNQEIRFETVRLQTMSSNSSL